MTENSELKIPQTKPGTFLDISKLSKIESKNKNKSEIQSLKNGLDIMSVSTPITELKSQNNLPGHENLML